MCGIAGIYNTSKSEGELNHFANRFNDLLQHRGPDGNGFEILKSNNNSKTLLTHTRLSIIDLSDMAKQPMNKYNGSICITYNGEIYNYKELRAELIKLGESFKTESDTEVIIAAYRNWGEKCFEKFIGMWALAIYDKDKNILILSRDRLGVKPLYFAKDKTTVIFGSEPKIILSYDRAYNEINLDSFSDYFSYRYPLGNKSFFKKINCLEPGTIKIFSNKNESTNSFWSLSETKKIDDSQLSQADILDRTADLISSSVKYRMISDVPYGSFLSGGLDSSIIVCEMSKHVKDKIKTYNIGFSDNKFNEFEYANKVSSYFGSLHEQVLLNKDEYFTSINELIKYKDAPLSVPNEIAIHKLSKFMKNDITVVLSGEGSDELFGGYGRIFSSAADYLKVNQLGFNNLNSILKKNILTKYKESSFNSELDFFINQYSYIEFDVKKNLLNKDLYNQTSYDFLNKVFFSNIWSSLDKLNLSEKFMFIFQKIHIQGLLNRLDTATMSASIEGRVPFIDHRLIEFVNALPFQYKIRMKSNYSDDLSNLNSDQLSEKYDDTKYLLRKIYKNQLPESIIDRKKIGFPVPLNSWTKNSSDYLADMLLSSNARIKNFTNQDFIRNLINQHNTKNSGLLLWMLLNSEVWMQEYKI